MANMKIGNHVVGDRCRPYIIAEVGINHNGELEKALAMVEVAAQAGADAVKFQTFRADELVGDDGLTYTYQSQGRSVTESMLAMFKRYEFEWDDWRLIKKRCDDIGISFLSTPQNRSDLDLLLGLGIAAIKVGSDDLTNIPLLKDYASTGLPLILSAGMADLAEIFQSLAAIGGLGGYPCALLVCTSLYPTPPAAANLLRIKTLGAAFPMLVLGFSDHTRGRLAAPVALALGAKVFEKHFTLDHDLPGPDHWFSEDPEGLRAWIKAIRAADEMLGSGIVQAAEEENHMKILARRTITAACDICPGDKLTSEKLVLRRPGIGLPAALWEVVVDSTAAKSLKRGDKLQWGDFEK